VIQLTSPADYKNLLKMPTVEATIVADEGLQTAPATFQRAGNNYEIVIDTSKIRFPVTDTVVEIQLSFDSSFVPKKKGSRRDDRELVVQAPALIRLMRR
jgi:hypothetical protein